MIREKGAFWRLFLWLALLPATATGQSCPAAAYDENATVRKVHDGDTVWLDDGRKVRLIGINAPELARDEKPAEAYATDSRNHLKQRLVQSHNRIRLVYGKERYDRYQRTLAHLFLPDGINLQADLIEHGFATASTYPPNTAFSDCYHRLESIARCEKKGLWNAAASSVRESVNLDASATGFHILSGKVERVSESSKGIWITMEGGLLLGVRSAELPLFDKPVLLSLNGQRILVSGWLHPKNNKDRKVNFYMRIRHPSAIVPSDGTGNIPKC